MCGCGEEMVGRELGKLLRRCGVGMGMSVFLKQDFANIMASRFVLRGLGEGGQDMGRRSYLEVI